MTPSRLLRSIRRESFSRKVFTLFTLPSLSYPIILVSRIEAKSEVLKLEIQLDVNTDIYPMDKEGYYSMAIASSINLDGSEEFDYFKYHHDGSADGLGALMD